MGTNEQSARVIAAEQSALDEIDGAPCKAINGACTSINSCWRHYRQFDIAARLAAYRLHRAPVALGRAA